jgi:P4 family phage/plasmid primase-like protien
MSTPLGVFLNAHRATDPSDWNLTGMGGSDVGKYKVDDDEYDEFLTLVNSHIFGTRPKTSSLLERHREVSPLLIDLDFRYEGDRPLTRRFNSDIVCDFIAQYAATMVYFSKVEMLTEDLCFYISTKPVPETQKTKEGVLYHKDGIHIQCPTLTTTPKYQFAIRGHMLQRNTMGEMFGKTGVVNPPEDCYDVSVIHRNNWFLYGACKPDKMQYRVERIVRLKIDDIASALDGGDPVDIDELVDIIREILVDDPVPSDTLMLMKTLSIRRGHFAAHSLPIRAPRASEWEELMIAWGAGKSKSERMTSTPALLRSMMEYADTEDGEGGIVAAGGAGATLPAVVKPDDAIRVTSATTADDIALAYRLCRECINPERRAGEYHDWVNLAICLKNIANNEDSFAVWVDVTRRVDTSHKKASYTDAELRAKWGLIRVDGSKKLGIGSLQHWAEEDNPDKRRSILSETYTDWIINYAKDTHVSIADFVCRIYRYEFCCCKTKKSSYDWYHYGRGAHYWKMLRSPTELRSRLSGRIKDEYIEAWRKLGKKKSELEQAGANKDIVEATESRRKELFKMERLLETTSFKDNVLRECQEKFEDDEFISKLNADPYLIGVANGVLELNHYGNESMTGRPHVHFRDGRPDDYVSFQMGRCDTDLDAITYIPYDPELPEQKELAAFFDKIYPDPDLREYVLTLLASCLEGANREQKFYVMQGVGSNGKSMIELLMELTFGDYGTSVSTTVFTRKRPDSGAANPDIITIQKRRYIHTGEPDDNEKINTAIMKQYSGGDRVAARGLFADQEKFSIMGKIFMSCNDLPPVSKMDNGTWRRLRVIPHISVFKDPGDAAINPDRHIYEKDLHLEGKLKHWRTAFLSLMVHYYETRYLEHGLREPMCVATASNKYKEENDAFSRFFTDCFVKDAAAGPIPGKRVRDIFRNWLRTDGRGTELKQTQMLERMKEMCGAGSTEREFWGVREAEDLVTDLSGAMMP